MSSFVLDSYRSQLTSYIARRVRNPSAVEDLVQDTFVQTLQWLEKENVPDKPLNMLYTVARNVIFKDYRDDKEPPQYGEDPDAIVLLEQTVEQEIASRQQCEILYKAIKNLPEKQRQVVILRKIYQYSQKEVANHLGITTETVKTHLRRGFKQLYKELKQ